VERGFKDWTEAAALVGRPSETDTPRLITRIIAVGMTALLAIGAFGIHQRVRADTTNELGTFRERF
jgi:hypothetical protein